MLGSIDRTAAALPRYAELARLRSENRDCFTKIITEIQGIMECDPNPCFVGTSAETRFPIANRFSDLSPDVIWYLKYI